MTKCKFCRKEKMKTYRIGLGGKTNPIVVCGACKSLFNQLKQFTGQPNATKMVFEMMGFAVAGSKSCIICRNFDTNRHDRCRQRMWTGVGGEHAIQYPLTFANHGCARYRERNIPRN